MKKRFINLLMLASILLASTTILAQNAPIDFEAGGNGADWTWTVFENDTNPPVEIVANPDASGANTSGTVAKITALQAGQPWVGCETMHGADIGTFTMDATNSTVKIMVYKSVISDVGIKFATATGAALPEIKVANTLVNQWEELTFDFSGRIGDPVSTDIDQIIIFPDFDLAGRTADNIVYFDNITFHPQIVPQGPDAPAPTPTAPASDVISLYSNAYADVTVDTWSAPWDLADVADVQVMGDDNKLYTNMVFAGIEFTSQTIDATAMTHFHMDIWTPDATDLPAVFRIKLVDFGADGAWSGGDDVEHELTFDANSGLITGDWVSFDIPLSDFVGLTTTGHLAQMIISGDPNTIYMDNVYFYTGETQSVPTVAAPTPTVPASNVISLFSDAYTDVLVDTWSAPWDAADLTETSVAGDSTKLYNNLVFAGIEFTSQTIDASAMTHFHMDIWTPDPTDLPAVFRIKLVDFGADGAWSGGDDVEHELTLDANSGLATGNWVSFDIPLSHFTGLTTTGHLAQLIISGDPNTVYVDNVYLYEDAPVVPTVAAPTPTVPASHVIALFSDAYTDVPVDTWSAPWDVADLTETSVAGDSTKLYTGLVFAGIEFTSQTIDASAMTHFHMDIWTPDPTDLPAAFRIKLVDFGADGAWSGGDDTEHELTFDANSGLVTGNWISFDIPFTDFTNLAARAHLAQLIISGDPNTVYVDNVYFYDENVMAGPTIDCNVQLKTSAGDGTFTYRMTFTNTTSSSQDSELWGQVTGPDGYSDLVFRKTKNFEPGSSKLKTRVYTIPAGSPAGDYTFTLYTGERGVSVDDSASQVYTKNGVNRLADSRKSDLKTIPTTLVLEQNYPNPFNPSTTISYGLPTETDVTLKIYNSLGQKVATLVNGIQAAGYHDVSWNGKDASGNVVAAGIYMYRIQAGSKALTGRMLLAK